MCWSPPYAVSPPQAEVKKFMCSKIHFSRRMSSLCNKQGFLNQEMDVTQTAKGIFAAKDPFFIHWLARQIKEKNWNIAFLQMNIRFFQFLRHLREGVKALAASQIDNQPEAGICATHTYWHENLCVRQNNSA